MEPSLKVIHDNYDLVLYWVGLLAWKRPYVLDVNDLKMYGVIGIMNAIRRYNPEKGAAFRTYCTQKVRGAILEAIRDMSPGERSSTDRLKEIEGKKCRLTAQLGREPDDCELAEALGITVSALMLLRWELPEVLYSDGLDMHLETEYETLAVAEKSVYRDLEIEELSVLVASLPSTEAQVVEMYYFQELTMREIGESMGFSESRACQLHKQALAHLRERMGEVA